MVQLSAIGQIARPVGDITKAAQFYGEVLGLPHLYTFGDLAFFDCGGVRLFLSASEESQSTIEPSTLYFRVDDIQTAYDDLTARGVVFEGAPHLIHRHENGMEEWMAFFRDPDGHLLAVMSQVSAPADPG
ncbi:MAG TPA: VOC family protein [Kribbellaceae bacterium]|nr:VOC family protein [Kribbellaceae bacterium]